MTMPTIVSSCGGGRGIPAAAAAGGALHPGELLERWTKKRSEVSLADSLAKHAITARLRQGDVEIMVDATPLRAGDMVAVRQGSFIPAEGRVMEGEGLVDLTFPTHFAIAVRIYLTVA